MSSNLLLGVRFDPKNLQTIKLSDVNFKGKVEHLRAEAAGTINQPKDSFELVYCGCILEDDATMESYGLKNGVMVHVLKKKETEKPLPAKSITESRILQLAMTFRSFNENPALRNALHRLSKRPEVIENIIATTPGLNEDSVSIAMLQDPDLMAHFTDPDTVRRIAELHPVLVEAARLISVEVHVEARSTGESWTNPSAMNAPSTAYSYSLDNLSDDEEMAGDSSQSSDSAQPNSSSNYNNSDSTITTAQLAAVLSRAGVRNFPLSNSSSSTGLITAEMFAQALQQAFESSPTPATNSVPVAAPAAPEFQRQLAEMHEIGLPDDAVNIRALQFTNGDVEAAIELVFSGLCEN